MKSDYLKEQLEELIKLNGIPYSYFISWNEYDNIESHEHGPYSELEGVIRKMESAVTCIQGELPINTLLVYFNTVCDVFKKNPYWDCVDDPSEDSHEIFGVPYVGMDGDWLYLNGTTKTEYIK